MANKATERRELIIYSVPMAFLVILAAWDYGLL